MQTIPAANNLVIQTDADVWRLLTNSTDNALPLIEATYTGLTYQATFARARNLPDGNLPAALIDQIIVGWAAEDSSWHLGMMVTPDYARERGGRWCGLTRWLDAHADLEGDSARTAGEALASALGKPFRFVPAEPPRVIAEAITPNGVLNNAADVADRNIAEADTDAIGSDTLAAASTAVLPDVRIMPLPIAMGEWALTEGANGLVWERSRAWRAEALGRGIFFGALAILFGLLAAGELRSKFAPVQPDWLPLVGAVVAAIMAAAALYHFFTLLMTSRVQFDRRNRMIRFVRRPLGVVKQVPFEKVENVLVSYAITRREPLPAPAGGAALLERIYPEVWIHVTRAKGDFLEVGHIAQTEGRAVRVQAHAPRRALHLEQIDTPVHQAAHLIADVMEVQTFVEDRS